MLRVKIEIVPYGDETKSRLIEEFQIINTGKHKLSPRFGEYTVHHKHGSFEIPHHRRSDGCFILLQKVLKQFL